jgi:hypothetical protein
MFSAWYFKPPPPSGHMGLHLRAKSSGDQERLADWLEGRGSSFTKLTLDVRKNRRVADPRLVNLDKIAVNRQCKDTACSIHDGKLTIDLTEEDGNRVSTILRTIDAWNEDSIEMDVDRKRTLLWFWHAG